MELFIFTHKTLTTPQKNSKLILCNLEKYNLLKQKTRNIKKLCNLGDMQARLALLGMIGKQSYSFDVGAAIFAPDIGSFKFRLLEIVFYAMSLEFEHSTLTEGV